MAVHQARPSHLVTGAKAEAVGSIWTIPAKADERVQVVRPDDSEIVVVAGADGALVALDQTGKYTSGEHSVTAK